MHDVVGTMVRDAFTLYSAGRPADAARKCEEVLRTAPTSADAMHLLAIVYSDAGHHQVGLGWAGRAIDAAPHVGAFRNTRGVLYERVGRLDLAAEEYKAASEVEGGTVRTLGNWGSALQRLGRNADAIEVLRRAVAMDPGDPGVMYNLATALQAVGESAEAEKHYRVVLRAIPDHPGALVNLGVICQEDGRLDEAEACHRAVLAADPSHFEALYGLGVTLRRRERWSEAVEHLSRAREVRPQSAEAHSALADVLRRVGRMREAVALYQKAVELQPGFGEAWCNLSGALVETRELGAVMKAGRRAVELAPASAEALANLAAAYVAVGRVGEAIELSRRSLAIDPDNAAARSNMLLSLQYMPDVPPERLFEEHLEWGRRHGGHGRSTEKFRGRRRDASRPIRVAYLSSDFCRHPVASFIAPVLAGHNRSSVEVSCYADERQVDEVTAELRGMADRWVAVTGMSDAAVAELVERDGVDVLVDLPGHTQGNRLGVLARRAAPVQATYLGYCGTTGLPDVDFRITDELTDRSGEERFYTERLVRLAGCFCCYRPVGAVPEVTASPAQATGHVTFGSLHALAKINDRVLDLWAEVMHAVPGARLLIYRDTIGDEERDRLGRALAARGVEMERLTLRGRGPEPTHLDVYGEIDVSLDVFPFSGHTTACEALWMGVPTVTLLRERHASRMVGSVLTAAGCPEWVAHTPQEYVAVATRMAADIGALAKVRQGLREKVARSALCDARPFCQELELSYHRMMGILR